VVEQSGEAVDASSSGGPAFLRVVEGRTYEGWEDVYRDNVVGIYHLVFRRVGNSPDAEDLCEEILIRALTRLRLPAPVHEVRSYLVKTARTVLAEHWRRHYSSPEAELDLDRLLGAVQPPERYPEQGGGAAERAAKLLALLPDRFRQVLELRFLRGYSVAETAREMGVSDSNAKVLQYRALRKAAELGGEMDR
jgi:RNA polymerase sigma factor (sigma-70 family)